MSTVITAAGYRALAEALSDEATELEKVAGSRSTVLLRRMAAAHMAAAAKLEAQRSGSQAVNLVDGILAWIEQRARPVLFSEILEAFGDRGHATFDLLIRNGHVRAVFPQAKPGDSGLQFWELVK